MRIITASLSLAVCLALAIPAAAGPYLRPGFSRVSTGVFYPFAGAARGDGQQVGLLTPVLEHQAADGYLLVPGISYSLLNVGYIGGTSSLQDFGAGKVLLGPSIETGELVKTGLRWACRKMLPKWVDQDSYGVFKAAFAAGHDGLYSDVGAYGALPLNRLLPMNKVQPEWVVGLTLNKAFGGAAPAKP